MVAPIWPRELCEVCSKYLMSMFGITTDENVLLKSITFLGKMPKASVK